MAEVDYNLKTKPGTSYFLKAENTPWQSQAVPTTNWFFVFAHSKNSWSSVPFNAPMPGAIEWLMRINDSGAAYSMSLVMVQGFFSPEERQT